MENKNSNFVTIFELSLSLQIFLDKASTQENEKKKIILIHN